MEFNYTKAELDQRFTETLKRKPQFNLRNHWQELPPLHNGNQRYWLMVRHSLVILESYTPQVKDDRQLVTPHSIWNSYFGHGYGISDLDYVTGKTIYEYKRGNEEPNAKQAAQLETFCRNNRYRFVRGRWDITPGITRPRSFTRPAYTEPAKIHFVDDNKTWTLVADLPQDAPAIAYHLSVECVADGWKVNGHLLTDSEFAALYSRLLVPVNTAKRILEARGLVDNDLESVL